MKTAILVFLILAAALCACTLAVFVADIVRGGKKDEDGESAKKDAPQETESTEGKA